MNKDEKIASINNKYTKLISEAWNDSHISLNQIFDEVLPKLKKEKEEEIKKINQETIS